MNAYVSIELFDKINKRKPEWLSKSAAAVENAIPVFAKALGKSPSKEVTARFSKDVVDITTLSIGGFLVVPFQKIYAANRVRISEWVENSVDSLKGLFGHAHKKGASKKENAIEQEESIESFLHWAVSRWVAYATGAISYLTLKYAAKNSYAKLNKSVLGFVKKNFPKRFIPAGNKTEYYVAEQVAAITAVSSLVITKTALDKLFPPKLKHMSKETYPAIGSHQKIIAETQSKSFSKRAEIKRTGPSVRPV